MTELNFDEVVQGSIEYNEGTEFITLAYVRNSEVAADPPTPPGFGFANSGTLTITEIDETMVAGTFTATVAVMGGNGLEQMEVEGTFTAGPRAND